LQSIIQQMNKSFNQFNDSAIKSGLLHLNPILAQQLQNLTDSFVTLAKSAAEKCDDDDEGIEPGDVNSISVETSQPPQPKHSHVGWGYSATEQRSSLSTTPISATEEYQARDSHYSSSMIGSEEVVRYKNTVSLGRIFDQAVSWSQPVRDDRQESQQLPFGLVDILSRNQYSPPQNEDTDVFSVAMPALPTPRASPPIPRFPTPPYLSVSTVTPKPSWTYSHDEITFARRLTRATLESGFYLLSSAKERPARLAHVFRLSLPYLSLSELRERFKMLLARGTNEDLDCWEVPFIHLGGAGTHYPRKDANGNVIKIPDSWTVRQVGPVTKKLAIAENSNDPNDTRQINIDLTGFEGEWFDAHDVQGYLEEVKGVVIDPKSSFIDAFVDDDQQPIADFEDSYFAPDAPSSALGVPPSADSSHPRRSSDESDVVSFSTGSSSTETLSSISTPKNSTRGIMDHLFAPSDMTFGLDMGVSQPGNLPQEFPKFPDVDSSAFFDQPLGLDLAPGIGFGMGMNNAPLPPFDFPSESDGIQGLGMDMMGRSAFSEMEQLPVQKQRRKKAVLVDVTKLVNGRLLDKQGGEKVC